MQIRRSLRSASSSTSSEGMLALATVDPDDNRNEGGVFETVDDQDEPVTCIGLSSSELPPTASFCEAPDVHLQVQQFSNTKSTRNSSGSCLEVDRREMIDVDRHHEVAGLWNSSPGKSLGNHVLAALFLILFMYSLVMTVLYSRSRSSVLQYQQANTTLSSLRFNDEASLFFYSGLFNTTIPRFKALPDRHTTTITKLAFGSCSSQNVPQPYWDTIVTSFNPDILLLMGDNVYGDCSTDNATSDNISDDISDNISLDVQCVGLWNAYRTMAAHPSVLGVANRIAVLATIDDHDYGQSDCHSDNPFKHIAQQYFTEFFQVPTSTTSNYTPETSDTSTTLPLGRGDQSDNIDYPDRDINDDGVYRAGIWGSNQDDLVQIILLDTRYNRSPFLETGNPHSPYQPPPQPNKTKTGSSGEGDGDSDTFDNDEKPLGNATTMLGERQWKWLEKQLRQKAAVRFIVSSFQVLNDGTGFDAWRHLPSERERLYRLIHDTLTISPSFPNYTKTMEYDTPTVFFLSGDRHVGGFYRYEYIPPQTESSESMSSSLFVEITSSSFTHSAPLNAYDSQCVGPSQCDEFDPVRQGDWIRENMFGTIDIHWNNRTVDVALRRSDSSYGAAYASHDAHRVKTSDAGQVLRLQTYAIIP